MGIFGVKAAPAGGNRNNKQSGDAFEDIALRHLQHAGLRLETRNYRTPGRGGGDILIHGDSHNHKIDHPLKDPAGQPIAHFTRIETYGAPFMGWVEVHITDGDDETKISSHPWAPAPFSH